MTSKTAMILDVNSDNFSSIEKTKYIAVERNKKPPKNANIAKNTSIIFILICFY